MNDEKTPPKKNKYGKWLIDSENACFKETRAHGPHRSPEKPVHINE